MNITAHSARAKAKRALAPLLKMLPIGVNAIAIAAVVYLLCAWMAPHLLHLSLPVRVSLGASLATAAACAGVFFHLVFVKKSERALIKLSGWALSELMVAAPFLRIVI